LCCVVRPAWNGRCHETLMAGWQEGALLQPWSVAADGHHALLWDLQVSSWKEAFIAAIAACQVLGMVAYGCHDNWSVNSEHAVNIHRQDARAGTDRNLAVSKVVVCIVECHSTQHTVSTSTSPWLQSRYKEHFEHFKASWMQHKWCMLSMEAVHVHATCVLWLILSGFASLGVHPYVWWWCTMWHDFFDSGGLHALAAQLSHQCGA